MPDNWGFVAAAYGLTALVLGLYWRRLVRREQELDRAGKDRARTPGAAAAATAAAERSRQPWRSGHPRREPASRPPLQ
jgi:hypothetical protein